MELFQSGGRRALSSLFYLNTRLSLALMSGCRTGVFHVGPTWFCQRACSRCARGSFETASSDILMCSFCGFCHTSLAMFWCKDWNIVSAKRGEEDKNLTASSASFNMMDLPRLFPLATDLPSRARHFVRDLVFTAINVLHRKTHDSRVVIAEDCE